MDDSRVGTALRAVRLRRGWRQVDVAQRAGVSDSTVSDMEKGRIGSTSLDNLRAVARTLDIRLDLVVRWRGGELDRLLNARHASLATVVVQLLQSHGWQVAPEVSFSIYGERGWIDILAWHPASKTLLVVEVKTQLVDVHETLGVVDRKRRLAPTIAKDRGWSPSNVAVWLVLEDGTTNRRRVHQFAPLLRAALPASTRAMNRWLRAPAGAIASLSFLPNSGITGARRVSRHQKGSKRMPAA
jgi:transcriptional regulator with XRE-family HTH domain